ncbi:MAG: ABC transporter ATP-binding protein [Pararhodobacter sp.]|nr:ABC transporter ATP-binding protein [Pararhodobacter sp.]
MSLLQANELSVALRLHAGDFPALSNLSFKVEAGRTLGIVGESGAGKSMITRSIAQLLPRGFSVTGGSLRFMGQDLLGMHADARRALFGREIAFIPQEPLSALNPVLTVGQQMQEHLLHIGVRRGEWRDRAIAALSDVQLQDPAGLLAKYPHQLSGGMCQRVLIAMAFVSRPKLLIADEPTTALDVTIQARIMDLIADLRRQHGTAVIFITHDLRLAAQICDEIMVLYAGRQAEYGPARALMEAPRHPYTRCLQLAVPAMTGPRRGLYILPERMPGLRAVRAMSGCRFAERCPLADSACLAGEPAPAKVAPGHVAACLRPEATASIAPPPPPDHAAASTTAGEPLLKLDGLGKVFVTRRRLIGKPDLFSALNSATLELHQGEFFGIVGESGSGKSTLGRLVVGLEQPTRGRIMLLGRDIGNERAETRAFRRENVQIVFQDPQSALNPRRRVAAIITQVLEAAGVPEAERQVRARELLAEIGLSPESAHSYPSQLSGGQKQRVNIARALCRPPQVLVADEIASGLDVSVQAQLLNLLLRLRKDHGFSMLFISHDLSVVRYLCDRVAVMNRGEIVETGRTEEVFANPAHPYTQTLLASVPPDQAAADTLDHQGATP